MTVDKKKVRNPRAKNADKNENRLFLDILKTAKSGKLWKIIREGTPKRQDSHDVCVTAAEIFSKESGKEISWTQAKSKWLRLKQITRKKADKTHSDREYRKLASKTGGGPPGPIFFPIFFSMKILFWSPDPLNKGKIKFLLHF